MYVATYDKVSNVESCGLEQKKCCMQRKVVPGIEV